MPDVLRLDAAASFNADSPTCAIGAGTDRGLIVGIQHEGDLTADSVSVTWGGQAMTQLVTVHVEAAGNDLELTLFLLLEAGIDAGVGTTIIITGELPDFTYHAASYENVNQGGGTDSVPETNSAGTTGATPNPLTTSDIVAGDGAAVVALAGVGQVATAAWGADLTEQTELGDVTPTATGSLADGLFATGQNVNVEATWSGQNRAAVVAIELAPTAGGAISGSASLALAVNGILSATVPISGSIPLTITPTAEISGGPAANVLFKSGVVSTPASGNSVVDVTDRGEDPFGIHLSWTDNTADNTIQAHAELGHGFSDGTNHRAVMHNAQDAASNNFRQSSITAAILVVNPVDDTILVEGTVTFQATTFTLVFTTVAIGFQIHYEVFGGSDGAAQVADVGADASPVTALGMTNGDLLLGATSGEQFPASSQFAYQTFGVAHDNGVSIDQWALFKYMGDNDEDFTGSALEAGQFMGQYDVDFADWTIQITALSGDGFTWTGTNADHFAYMILDLGGLLVDVGTMTKTIAASPATHTFPDLGFIPQGYSIASASDVSDDRTVNQAMRGSFGSFDGSGTGHSINAIVTVSVNTPRDSLSSSDNVINMGQDFGGGNVQSEGQAQAITDSQPQIIFDPNTNQAEIIGYYALEAGAAVLQASGTIALVITPTGALRADALISGSSDLVLTPAGTIRADAAIAGSSDLAFTVAGAMRALAMAEGTIPLIFTPTGTVQARGALAGSADLVLTPAATLTALAAMLGSASLVFTPAGNLAGMAGISGSADMIFTPTGAMIAKAAAQGTIDLALTPTGAVQARGAIAGSVALLFTPAATIQARGDLTGSADMTLTPTGLIQGITNISGAIPLVLTPAGTLLGLGGISGSSDLVLAATGALQARGELAGSVALVFTPAGTVAGQGALAGSVTMILTPSAQIEARGELAGTIDIVFDITGQLVGAFGIQGTVPLVLTATATLEALAAISGSASLVITPDGTLQATGGLLGSSALTIALAGDLRGLSAILGSADLVLTPAGTIAGLGALAGSSALVFDANGALQAVADLAGTIPLSIDAAGALVARGDLAGGLTMTLTPSGTIIADAAIAGALTMAFTVTGAVGSPGQLIGSADITIDANGQILGKVAAAGSVDMVFTPAATLQGRTAIQGSAALTITPDGTLRGVGDLAGLAELAFTLAGIMFDQGARRIPNSLQSFIVFLDNSRQDLATGTDNATQTIDGAFNSIQTIEAGVTNSSQ